MDFNTAAVLIVGIVCISGVITAFANRNKSK